MPEPVIRVLSIVPPMTQLNTPYPSTAYLTGFLRERGFQAQQEDLALQLALALLSPEGLAAVHDDVKARAPATLCLQNIADLLREAIDPAFV